MSVLDAARVFLPFSSLPGESGIADGTRRDLDSSDSRSLNGHRGLRLSRSASMGTVSTPARNTRAVDRDFRRDSILDFGLRLVRSCRPAGLSSWNRLRSNPMNRPTYQKSQFPAGAPPGPPWYESELDCRRVVRTAGRVARLRPVPSPVAPRPPRAWLAPVQLAHGCHRRWTPFAPPAVSCQLAEFEPPGSGASPLRSGRTSSVGAGPRG